MGESAMELTGKNIFYYLVENMPEGKKSFALINEYFRIIKKELKNNSTYCPANDENIIKTPVKTNFGTIKLNVSLKKTLNKKCSYLDERIENLNHFTFNQLRMM